MSSEDYSYEARLRMLRAAKLKEAEEKRQLFGAMDHDEWGIVLPPESSRQLVETMSSSGVISRDVLFNFVTLERNHTNGDFYGAARRRPKLQEDPRAPPRVHRPQQLLGRRLHDQFLFLSQDPLEA